MAENVNFEEIKEKFKNASVDDKIHIYTNII